MSDGYVKKLLDATKRLEVLRSIAIRTGDEREAHLRPKTTGGDNPFTYRHVPKASRISYFDLRPEARPAKHLKLFIEDQLISTQFTSWCNAKTLRPLFYLPYRRNDTTRMKLSEPDNYTGPGVRLFTTAMIDGCSVYIEGPPETPKVTHINANLVRPTVREDSWELKQEKIAAKIEAMDGRFAHLRKAQAAVVERPRYIIEEPQAVITLKARFAATHGGATTRVLQYHPFASVLGFKDGGRWSFWLQQNAVFDWRRGATGPLETTFAVLGVRQIWPNGGGYFRLV